MKLTKDQKKKFIAFVNDKNDGTLECNVCGIDSWNILEELTYIPCVNETTGYKTINIVCDNCGQILTFDARMCGAEK